MLVDAAVFVGDGGEIVDLVLVRLEDPHGQEGDALVEQGAVPGGPQVVVDDVG